MPTTTPIPSVALRVKKNLRDAAEKCNALLAHQARQEERYGLEDAAGNLLEVKHSATHRYPLRSLPARK